MALRQPLGHSSGEVMREDAIPCSRCTRIFATVAGVGGVLLAWPLCHIQYGPRVTWPRVYRWQLCGAVGAAIFMGTFARLWEPASKEQGLSTLSTMTASAHEEMETSEEESLFIRPSSSPAPLRQHDMSNVPVLRRSNSSLGNWSPHLQDLHILSFSFLFIFLAYSALQNLESSLHEDDGLGSTAIGVLYLSLTISSLGAPLFVVWLGSKRALLVGLSGYWVFTAANLYPSWYTMIPASLFLGFTASILWCAEGTYLTSAAKSHAASCDVSEESAIGTFNGEFWGIYASNQVHGKPLCLRGSNFFGVKEQLLSLSKVMGNLISLALLYFGKGSTSSGDTSTGSMPLIIAFLGSMTVGTVLAFFLTSQDLDYMGVQADELSCTPTGNGELTKGMCALLCEKKMLLLILVLIYTGLQQGFIWGDFTKDIITPSFGVAWIGGVMAVYGAADALSSVLAGRFSTGLAAIAVITCVGAVSQGLAILLLICKQQYGDGWMDLFLLGGIAVAWGVGDATFNTQISALLGILYPGETEAAFAQWKIWQSAATSAAFFASARMDLFIKLYILLALLVLSMATFIFVIVRRIGQINSR